jgi:surface polysaccharide O-acyltransferase-like enzyme
MIPTVPHSGSIPTDLPRVSARNHSIDAFRVFANWAIICVHTGPFISAAFSPEQRMYGELFNQFVRVATPFFFLAAGYFFAVSVSRGAAPLPHAAKLIKRLAILFLFWALVYVFVPIELMLGPPAHGYWESVGIMWSRTASRHFITNGNKVHLWFLPALACCLTLLAVACRLKWERALFVVAVGLYFFGLYVGAYQDTPIGWDISLNPRNGPFFGMLFVISGYMIQRLGWQFTQRQALGLIVLGIVLRVAELYWITDFGTRPSEIDFLLGTYPFGLGIFMLLALNPGLGKHRWIVRLSRYSPGVYCGHALVIDLLKDRPPLWADPLWEVARPFVGLALMFALVIGMSRFRVLRPVVT